MTGGGGVAREAMRFLREEAGFAQLITVTAEGFPVARTVGAQVNDDWSVDLVQRKVHRRLAQLRHNPRLELVWVGSPAPGSSNDRPAVFDFGLLVPRVVLLRGIAEQMDGDRTVACYQRAVGAAASPGPDRGTGTQRRERARRARRHPCASGTRAGRGLRPRG